MNEEIVSLVHETVGTEVYAVWFLIGAALVFFMQCGFAMVEAGFTRAKNAGNIIMKNLMDFCIGTVVFILLGFGLMMSEDYVMGLFGVPNLGIFTDYANFEWSSFVFNLVFCATAATIVSGAMAERTKFISYCIYSGPCGIPHRGGLGVELAGLAREARLYRLRRLRRDTHRRRNGRPYRRGNARAAYRQVC